MVSLSAQSWTLYGAEFYPSRHRARELGPSFLRALADAFGLPQDPEPGRFFVGRVSTLELVGPDAIGGVWTVDSIEEHAWPR